MICNGHGRDYIVVYLPSLLLETYISPKSLQAYTVSGCERCFMYKLDDIHLSSLWIYLQNPIVQL